MRAATDAEVEALVRDHCDVVRDHLNLADEAQVSTTLASPRCVVVRERDRTASAVSMQLEVAGEVVRFPVRFEPWDGAYHVESPYWRVKR